MAPAAPARVPQPGATGSAGEIVPAEPPPAEQDQRPAGLRPHQVAEPVADGGDAADPAPGRELQPGHGTDQQGETDDGDAAAHRRTRAQPASSHIRNRRCAPGAAGSADRSARSATGATGGSRTGTPTPPIPGWRQCRWPGTVRACAAITS